MAVDFDRLTVKSARLILVKREVAMHHREDGEDVYIGVDNELVGVSIVPYLVSALVSCIVCIVIYRSALHVYKARNNVGGKLDVERCSTTSLRCS
jgi:hypothetical protein